MRAERIVDDLDSLSHTLTMLRMQHEEVMKELAQENPHIFGDEALRRIMRLPEIVKSAYGLHDPVELAEYIAFIETEGFIPKGFLKLPPDPEIVEIRMPQGSPRRMKREWRDPIFHYLAGKQLIQDAGGVPMDYPLDEKIEDLIRRIGSSKGLNNTCYRSIDLIKQLATKDFVKARQAFLRLKVQVLKPAIARINEDGFAVMDDLEARAKQLIDQGSLAHAEALIDYCYRWISRLERILERVRELHLNLMMMGEKFAAAEFMRISRLLVTKGDLEGLQTLYKETLVQTKGGASVARAQRNRLKTMATGAMTVVIEAARALGALPESESRRQLAATLPSVDELLDISKKARHGKVNALRYLKRLGLPVPGDDDVPALSAGRYRGYIPAEKQLESGRDDSVEEIKT